MSLPLSLLVWTAILQFLMPFRVALLALLLVLQWQAFFGSC
jgi:hypothetical protein